MYPGLIDALSAAGLAPAKGVLRLVGEGKEERFRVENDKPGTVNGWLALHDEAQPVYAVFGTWKRPGETHYWCERRNNRPPTAAEKAELQRRMAAAKAARDAEEARAHAEARAKAQRILSRARVADGRHPYLAAKGFLPPYGLRQLGNTLVVPVRDTAGVLHTLQFIGADGSKKYLKGGRIKACYHAIGQLQDENVLLLAEGFATAAALAVATDYAVAACLSAGNLLPAGLALRAKFPDVRMFVCADRDEAGLNAAYTTARAIGATVVVPPSVKTAKPMEAAHGPQ